MSGFFNYFFCFTCSKFYFVEKVGVQSGTPAPAREVPGPFHFLVEICGNDHRDQNQSTVFPANIKQKSMHFGVFKAFAILSPSKQSTSSIVKNHQKSPNRNQCTLQFQGICHDVLWNESNFGNFWRKHAKTIRRYPKSIAAPVPVMRNLITRRRSSKVWLQIHWPKSHWNLWSWAPGLFSRASR